MAKKTKVEPKPVQVGDPDELKGELKSIGGSKSDHWNNLLANSAAKTLWLAHSDDDTRDRQYSATVHALIGIAPTDELEGMLAAQLLATHYATMECYRRAMISEQTFEGRRENLNQANKLSRTYATLLEALNRHRGKGTQTVRVERVTVNQGGQAIVGNVEHPGGGHRPETADQPHALEKSRSLAHAPGTPMPSTIETEREGVPIAGGQR